MAEHRLSAEPTHSRWNRNAACTEESWVVVESATDAIAAARAATGRVIDLLASHWGFTEIHGYLLCSVAMHLRLSQVVNDPMYTVSAAISKSILPGKSLFR
jgi:acetamidase/formamidase